MLMVLSLTSFIKPAAPSFWAIEKYNGHFYLKNPRVYNKEFYIGIDTVVETQQALSGRGYISNQRGPLWASSTSRRIYNWGFSGTGAWSDERIFPYCPHGIVLNILRTYPNIEDKEWENKVDKYIKEKVRPRDYNLIGYWEDNELSSIEYKSLYLKYFKTCHDSIMRYDPNHLIFGVRMNSPPSDAVLLNSRGYVNAQSFNIYTTNLHEFDRQFGRVYNLCGVPSFISEFSFYSDDNSSNDKNTRGFGGKVASQIERKRYFEMAINIWRANPLIIGADWFQYFDEPPSGRYDGEDCNYGLVDIFDSPYPVAIITNNKYKNKDK